MADRLRRHLPHNAFVGEVPVPHGPETGTEHEHLPRRDGVTTEEEREVFSYLTRPDDSYTPDGRYWADLPFWERLKFVRSVDNAEARKELGSIWAMMKKDPLAPVGWYMRNAVLPGAGLGLEGYVLFSIGNLEPLFAKAWPSCWGKNPTECTKNWIAAVTYLEVVGIMVGQIAVGVMGDWIGRRYGLIQDAVIMFLGLVLLTGSWAGTLQGWVILYAFCLFFYSFGVGGEYPMTATSSMEDAVGAGKLSTREDRLHRGRKVTMAFLMQGWGQLVNQALLIVLLLIFNHGNGDPPYGISAVQWTFRLSFAIPAVGTLWLVYYRTWKMPHASRQLQLAKKKASVTGYDVHSLRTACAHFGGRMVATAGTWFCNDVFFYGNKLFQAQFIAVISSNPESPMVGWVWNLCNIIVSLVGYYMASFLIDNKFYGRKRMMEIGFFMDFILFIIPAFGYDYFIQREHIRGFQAMYFLSSFFNQFGPNSVTFLVAAEVFPTPVRASAHGLAACIGKSGALLASVLYNYIDTRTKFYVVVWFGLVGLVLTTVFLPDTTGLDLKEQERRWEYIRQGRPELYQGPAVHPRHLSLWERWWGSGSRYDAEANERQRIDELGQEWRKKQAAGEDVVELDDEFDEAIHGYFQKTAGRSSKSKALDEKAVADGGSSERATVAEGEVESEKGRADRVENSRRG